MTELKEKQLESVSGGYSEKGKVIVNVDYSNEKIFTNDITIKPYLDGVLLSAMIKTVDYTITNVNITVHGTRGISSLKVKINDEIIKYYEIDFDKASYREIV